MLRLLPLLAFALLPAVVAAPVPPGGRVEFGANGLLTRADLEKVRFDSRPVKEGRRAEAKPKAGPREFDVAAHLPWTKFRKGETMPAYFVLRNNRDKQLGLLSRMDFSGPEPTMQGGECSFDVRDRATGKSVLVRVSAATNCGGGSLVDVPANGFYCVRADLNSATGAALPPGDYEVAWSYGPWASAPVLFTVLPANGAKLAARAKRYHSRFYHLTEGREDEARSGRAGDPCVWSDSSMSTVHADSMAAALAVGQHGVYVPDLHSVPTADKLVEAWVEWKPYREGDRVAVTLRAVPPYKQVRIAELPQLFLQLDAPDEANFRRSETAEDGKQFATDGNALVTPLTIDVQLPKEWRGQTGVSGTARVAVLVVAL